ncbi:helix-turn-helix transcriptional regulator [Rhodococcus erythropolis]|uniref:Helix-turn-helix transcriptional regulator n=1 Tax=Rhodococcus erythropolis TaxID=1833 RepID=A0A8I1D4Q3_RHOER|nr:helix-turn-helix transcriptional regulator [Rhodococcus erythropolis]MBH5141437.1 helix-turn-helix transcriptional regulator [Rhodococcus erythropolis]
MEFWSADEEFDSEGVEDRFARRVRSEREARGLSQADLAKLLSTKGVRAHPTTVGKIESRDGDRPRSIRLDEAAAISAVFGIPLDDLVGRPQRFDRQAAIDRVRVAAIQTLQSIASAVEPLGQAIQALKIDPENSDHLAELNKQDLDSVEVGPIFQRAVLMGVSRRRLAEKLDSISEVIGEIGGYATMDEELVTAQFRELTSRTDGAGTRRLGVDDNPS